jgi:hypothetical protein
MVTEVVAVLRWGRVTKMEVQSWEEVAIVEVVIMAEVVQEAK